MVGMGDELSAAASLAGKLEAMELSGEERQLLDTVFDAASGAEVDGFVAGVNYLDVMGGLGILSPDSHVFKARSTSTALEDQVLKNPASIQTPADQV